MPAPLLSDLIAPGRCAVLVQEVQEGVIGSQAGLPQLAAAAAEVGVIEHTATVLRGARKVGVPILHLTASNVGGGFGSNRNGRLFGGARRSPTLSSPDGVDPVAGLAETGDIILPRFHGLSPLSGTQLDSLLRNEGISTVIVTGVSLNVAITNMVFDAVNRAYQVVLVTDAVAGTPVEYGESVVRHTLSLLATLATSAEVAATWTAMNT